MDVSQGRVCLLTTTTRDGGLRTRPVTLFPADGCDGVIFTGTDAAKLDEIEASPHVTLAGPTADGWWSAEATALVDRSSRLAGPLPGPVATIDIAVHRARRWTVHSDLPWDNTEAEVAFAGIDHLIRRITGSPGRG